MIIGITGSFGSGKSTAAKMFGRLGAYVIDADKVYHSLIRPGENCYKKIVRHFGRDVLGKTGRIDREKLRNIVFKEKTKLKQLNRLVQPEIIKEIKDSVSRLRRLTESDSLIVIDAALLVESGFYKKVYKIVVVKNKTREQVKRLKHSKGLTEKDITRRIKMQMPFKKKAAFADFIIDNSGSKAQTLRQVKYIWQKISEAAIVSVAVELTPHTNCKK